MKKSMMFAMLLLPTLAQAQAPVEVPPTGWVYGIFAPNTDLSQAGTTPPIHQLTIPREWPTCNLAPLAAPVPTTPFLLTKTPLTSALISWDDPFNSTATAPKICQYQIFGWLNSIRPMLQPGFMYPAGMQGTAPQANPSAFVQQQPSYYTEPANTVATPKNLRVK